MGKRQGVLWCHILKMIYYGLYKKVFVIVVIRIIKSELLLKERRSYNGFVRSNQEKTNNQRF